MEKQERSSFSSRVGFVLAASGSAVGLGNLWRFPYLAARYGGGIFLLVYLILVVTFGFSLMITEFAIGRKTRLSCIGAYGALDKRFNFLGWIAAFVPLIITPYYCVIGGWVMKYLWTFISGGALEAADNGGFFSRFISFDAGSLPATILNFSGPTPWFVLFVLITGLVVIFGVQKGIENDPNNPELWSGLGRVYDKLGDNQKALEAFGKAVGLTPDDFNANFNYALMVVRSADNMTTEFNGKSFTSREERDAEMAKLNEAYAKALAPLEKAHSINPEEPITVELLKSLYFRLRDESPEMMDNFNKYNELFKSMQQ